MSDLAGINLAMQTPFKVDGSIDFQEWERLIDAYIDAGVHGLVLGSGTGQHPYLTEQECKQRFEKVLNGPMVVVMSFVTHLRSTWMR